jgi:sulfur relay (sulfurtransferase) DsrC/TusE family protein
MACPPSVRSIWLMPSHDDEALLSLLIRDLADRFGTPHFQPHVTLRGDTTTLTAQLAEAIAVAARQVAIFAEPISTVEITEAFFRAFYARFAVSPALETLKRSLDPAEAGSFLPHISLLYGTLPAERKAPAAAELGRSLSGRWITFDRICVVSSGQDIPISEWSILATEPLRMG